MASDVPMSPELEQVDGEIQDIFRALQNGFQKIDKIKDANRQSKQLEDLTGKMRECKRLIKEFDRILKEEEKKNPPDVNKQLNDKKQFMIKELNSYVTLRKTYQSSLGNKRIELFDTGNDQVAEDTVQMASEMSNQELIHAGRKQMDQTDQAIERSKMVVAQTVEVGAQTAATLTQQVKAAYRKMVMESHPDRFPEHLKSQAESKFKEIAEAYTCLKDGRRGSRMEVHVMRPGVPTGYARANKTLVKAPFLLIMFTAISFGAFSASRAYQRQKELCSSQNPFLP